MAYRFSHPTVFTYASDTQESARLLIRRIGAALYVAGGLTMVVTLLAPSSGRPALVAFLPVGLACFGLAAYLVLALLDLDHFKRVNDSYGHPAGDRALRRFCDIVQSEKRTDDVLGRLGGEEFGLILNGTDLDGAHRFADRLRETVARETASGEVALTVSIGLAQAEPWTTADDLLRGADVALYYAKAAGRNRVTVHTGELTPA